MKELSTSDLKTILHSKRANLCCLQHCRVMVNGRRVEYITEEGCKSRYWNIPIANTTAIILGTGTSILVSQCHKNALTETRRILDQFAQRLECMTSDI